jgi:hypothetical protein
VPPRAPPPALNEGYSLTPRIPSSLSKIRDIYRSAPKPTKLVAGAASAAAVAGVAIALSASATPGAAELSAVNHAPVTANAAGHATAHADRAAAHLNIAKHGRPAVKVRVADKARAPQHKAAAAHKAPAHHAAPRHAAKPWRFYDSLTPNQIPAHKRIATYATGHLAAPASEVAGRGPIMWIDVTGYDYKATALDTEPGDATPQLAADWALHRLQDYPSALAHIYTFKAEWPQVKADVAATVPHKLQDRIRWWIADPTGYPHMVPGAQATQWYWGSGYDISTASPGF